MSNPTSTSSSVSKLVRSFVRLLVFLLILGLTTLVVYLFSERNSQTFSLHIVEDTLVIHKGKFLPIGSNPWNPENEAYAPIALEGFLPYNIETAKYRNIVELDRALFSVLEALAKPRILSEESAVQERGIYYLNRAERLKGIDAPQQQALKTLHAEAAFSVARTRLPQAELFLRETVEQFKLAMQTPNKNASSAAHALLVLEPALKQLGLAIQEVFAFPAKTPPPPHAPKSPEGVPPPSLASPLGEDNSLTVFQLK